MFHFITKIQGVWQISVDFLRSHSNIKNPILDTSGDVNSLIH